MVDPYQVIIDNGNKKSKHSDRPNASASLTQAMNELGSVKTDDGNPRLLDASNAATNATGSPSDQKNWSSVNACIELGPVFDENQSYDEIMCGPSSRHGVERNIHKNSDSIDDDLANNLTDSASILFHNGVDIGGISDNVNEQAYDGPRNEEAYATVNNKSIYDSNDTHTNQAHLGTTTHNFDSAGKCAASAASRNNSTGASKSQIAHAPLDQSSEMDSRKVEPLRINISRDAIKTIIKLNANDRQQPSNVSPRSSSPLNMGDDEFDDIDMEETATASYPKITIKPVKPPEMDYRQNHGSAQEAIPKLKIKKIDSTSSTLQQVSCSNSTVSRNNESSNNSELYQHHHSTGESYSVPKSATVRNSANTNTSIGSTSNDPSESASTSEVVPKLTIKLDNHLHSPMQSDSTTREVSLVSDDGFKVTLKPIAGPPLPKLTIKTNAYNDTAEVVMVKNSSNEQTDESSDETPSQPPSSQPSPNNKISSHGDYPMHRISSTSSPYQAQNIDDNLSTCSSGSSSSYSSSSSISTPNNDIKLIIKATSTGSCIVSPNTSAVRSSPSTTRNASGYKTNNKTGISDQGKANNSVANTVTSSNANPNDAIPKLNIKLSSADYPQLIHNDETDSESARTGSPLPKLTIRMQSAGDDSIVIPKVTIKPVINPNESLDTTNAEPTPKVTPKIILKPIPKPIDKPLEINTSPGSPFRNAGEHEGQQSPRIILKINKNATSQNKESKSMLSSTTIITEDPTTHSDLQASTTHNENKRAAIDSGTHDKRRPNAGDDVVQLLSSDSDLDEMPPTKDLNSSGVQADVIKATVGTTQTPTLDSNSGLRSMLSRPQKKIQPQPLQNFLQAIPAFRGSGESGASLRPARNANDMIDLCQDSGDLLSSVSSSNDELNAPTVTDTGTNETADGKGTSQRRNWQYLNNVSSKDQQPAPIHPLVQYDTERANILAAMMEAENSCEQSSNGSNNNNMSKMRNDMDESASTGASAQLDNDGSSSDCIMIEDKSSESCTANDYCATEPTASALLVSNIESSNSSTPVAKRPRGRPRKTPATDTPIPAKPKSTKKKHLAKELSKRKAAALLAQSSEAINPLLEEDAVSFGSSDMHTIAAELLATPSNSIASAVSESLDVPTTIDDTSQENVVSIDDSTASEPASAAVTPPRVVATFTAAMIESPLLNDNQCMDIDSPPVQQITDDITPIITTPSTSAAKDRKRRIIVDDDDESPTFNPLRSSKKARGRNSRSRKSLLNRKQRKLQLLSPPLSTDKPTGERLMFTSPESIELRKIISKDITPCTLQVFEEDTQMSADSLLTSPTNRTMEIVQNDESQSSLHSSTSATVENSVKKFRSKIEVVDPEGRTEFMVDKIAEYDWPPPKSCGPSRSRDSFMIQEQIAEYLGVKSFKRKYPDLPRRMVEMEERNYLMEKGLVSEKMCDLGLTAVSASDVLDIMHTDFYEKYDEYRRHARDRQLRELAARQKQMQTGAHGKSLSARENAMRAASSWNLEFNRSRKENRRECLDLQNFVIQTTEAHRNRQSRPSTTASHYPLALVPGQFQEQYHQYSAAELLCLPINTVLANPYSLDKKLRDYYQQINGSQYNSGECDSDSDCDSDCSDCSSGSSSSDSSDDSSDSIDENTPENEPEENRLLTVPKQENCLDDSKKPIQKPRADKSERKKCRVCDCSERCNPQLKPEIFVECSDCRRTAHPTCLKMSTRMVRRINEYAWQCKDCRFCMKCRRSEDNDKLFSCDQCDRSYHIYCVGQRKIPEGKWHCTVCTVCTLCGARRPEGHNNPNLTPQQKQKLLAVAKWTHEYRENPVTKELEHQLMLCTSCIALKNSSARSIYFS